MTTMRPAREGDPTAPEYAVEIVASKHHIVLDFEYRAQRDACLQIWVAPRRPPRCQTNGRRRHRTI